MAEETKKKILVAEDERPMSRALELKLKASGFDVVSAYNGKEALEKINSEKFDLVLLDLIMPELDGFGVLEALKGKTDRPIVIVSTNLGQESDEKRARDLGANGYFVKADTSILDVIKKVQEALT